jgi:hypothetical protein
VNHEFEALKASQARHLQQNLYIEKLHVGLPRVWGVVSEPNIHSSIFDQQKITARPPYSNHQREAFKSEIIVIYNQHVERQSHTSGQSFGGLLAIPLPLPTLRSPKASSEVDDGEGVG